VPESVFSRLQQNLVQIICSFMCAFTGLKQSQNTLSTNTPKRQM